MCSLSLVWGGKRCCRIAGLSKATFYFLPLPLPLPTVSMVTAGAHRGRSLLSHGRGARVITLLSLEFYFFFTLIYITLSIFISLHPSISGYLLSLHCTRSLSVSFVTPLPRSLFSLIRPLSFILSPIRFIDLTFHPAFSFTQFPISK